MRSYSALGGGGFSSMLGISDGDAEGNSMGGSPSAYSYGEAGGHPVLHYSKNNCGARPHRQKGRDGAIATLLFEVLGALREQ